MTQAAPRWGQMQRTDHILVPAQAQTPEVTVGRSPPPERRFLHLRSQMVRPVPDDVQRLLRRAVAQRICAVAPSHPGEAGPAARGGGLTAPGGDRPCAPVHCPGLCSPAAAGGRGASGGRCPPTPSPAAAHRGGTDGGRRGRTILTLCGCRLGNYPGHWHSKHPAAGVPAGSFGGTRGS